MNRIAEVLVFNPGSKMRAKDVRVTPSHSCTGDTRMRGPLLSPMAAR